MRLAELDDLLVAALRGQQRLSPTRLRWLLDPAAEPTARDLAARGPIPFATIGQGTEDADPC